MKLFEELLVLRDEEPRGGAMQMALDEALLLESRMLPLLRFYTWRSPAISFGYFSRLAEVERSNGERDIVRRWTGGGIVPHGQDVTYSFVIPREHPLLRAQAVEIYQRVHAAIAEALRACGIESALATASATRQSDTCFANPVRADVLADGKKIAGAAQRRSRAGLLHQGSIQVTELPASFRFEMANRFAEAVTRFELNCGTLARAEEIAAAKYARPEWLRLR